MGTMIPQSEPRLPPSTRHSPPTTRRSGMRASVMFLAALAGVTLAADGPCVSGPKVGQRPGPYSFVMSTGDQRGKSHCYICETEDRPAVIVFARSLNEPLAKLV